MDPSERKQTWLLLLAWVLVVSTYLYFSLFVPPTTPLWLLDDEGIFLLDALRMLHGQSIYRDFFQFVTPGTQLIYLVLFRLLGVHNWIPNALLLFLGLCWAVLSVVISRKVLAGWNVHLPGLIFLTFAFRRAFAVSHHWWSELAVMGALVVLLEQRTRGRLALAGALCGIASFFTQSQGLVALLGFAAFLLWESSQRRWSVRALFEREAALVLPFAAVVASSIAYFVWNAGARRLFDDLVVFTVRYYSRSPDNRPTVFLSELPRLAQLHDLPRFVLYLFIHALVPLIYVAFIIYRRREAHNRPAEPWNQLTLLSTVGLFLFIGIASAPTWFRVCTVSLPALIVFAWLLSPSHLWCRIARAALWAAALALLVTEPYHWQHHWLAYMDVPGGRIAFGIREAYPTYEWVLQRTHPGEYFFEAVDADMYFTLGLTNPTQVPFVSAYDYTRPEQVTGVIDLLREHQVRFVLWSKQLDPEGDPRARGDHLEPLRHYLQQRYQIAKTFPNHEQVWELKR